MLRLLSALFGKARASSAAAAVESGDPDFAARLHGQLSAQPGNVFYSPLGIRMALALAQACAAGETATELEAAIGWGDDPALAIRQLQVQWRAANRLWAEKSRKLDVKLLAVLRDRYGAPLEALDFKNAPDASRGAINAWVSDATEGKINNLIPPAGIRPDTKLVITNAVYFKARWTKQFASDATRPETFHAPGGEKRVPMMHQVDHFRVARVDDALMLEMPYVDGSTVMNVVLPDVAVGIASMEKRFVTGALPAWVAKLEYKKVDVALPSFTTQASLDLAEVLAAMGVKRAFRYPDADFSAIDGTRELFISRVIHQAFVAVDEEGTEAAAATAMLASFGAAPVREDPIVFRADRPFLVIVRDTKSGEPMFVGRILDPKE